MYFTIYCSKQPHLIIIYENFCVKVPDDIIEILAKFSYSLIVPYILCKQYTV